MKRRDFLLATSASVLLATTAQVQAFEVTRTDAEWRAMLT
ncbi:MAG: peptide-methionine (R)-S-oxide reductase, partial [Pseudomonadota bacterium]